MPLFRRKEKKSDESVPTETPVKTTELVRGDWRQAVAIRNGEFVILNTEQMPNVTNREIFERLAEMFNVKGDIVLTNQRLIFLRHKYTEETDGKVTLSYELQNQFPLDSIKDAVLRSEEEVTIYTNDGEYDLGMMGVIKNIQYPSHGDETTYFFNYFRKQLIEQKEKRVAAITIDFSFLKHTLEKGGIVLTTLTCPKCNAPIKLPPDGIETVCEHCGSTVYAQDIFKKLKTLSS